MKKLSIELDGELLQYFINECQINPQLDKIDIRDEILEAIKTQVVREDVEFAKGLYFDNEFNPSDLQQTKNTFKAYNEYMTEKKEQYPSMFSDIDLIKIGV